MAEEIIQAPSFDLGVEDSGVYGNLKAAEAFLSETVTGDADDLEEIDEEAEKAKKKAAATAPPKKKPEEKKAPDGDKLAEDFLSTKDEEDEEDEEDEKVGDKKGEGDEDDEDGKEESTFESLSKELYKANVLTADSEEDQVVAKTAEEFLDLFNKEKQKGASTWLENYLARFGEDRRDLFDAIFVDGVEPKEYLSLYNEIEDYKTVNLEDEVIQEKVVKAYYKKASWTDEAIQKKVDKLKSYGDLEEEAKTLHPLIVAADEEKLETMRVEKVEELKRQELIDKGYKEGVTKLLQEKLKEKNFNGIPLDEAKARKAQDFLHTKKWKTPSGELLTDYDVMILNSKKPENLSHRVIMSLLALDNWDFSKIEKKAISKESNALFSSLAQKKEKKSNKLPTRASSWANL